MPHSKLTIFLKNSVRWGAVFGVFVGLGCSLWGQTITINDTTGWQAWTSASTGLPMTDVQVDQQTGQGQDDFVGNATYAGFQQKAGQLGGVDSFLFRARFDKFDGVNQWGNGGNFGIGMDLDGNGSIDLIVMMTENSGNVNNRTRTIMFGSPGSDANISPSTTSWSFASQTPISLTAGSTYGLQQATDGSNFNGTPDSLLTFGLSFASLQNAIRLYAKVPTGQPANYWQNFTVDFNTRIGFIAFTSTQNNALNQDLFGAGKISTLDPNLTFAQLGALTPPISPYGVVPEPATYAQIGAFLVAGGFLAYRRRKTARVAAERADLTNSRDPASSRE